jgi:hypothetical protein
MATHLLCDAATKLYVACVPVMTVWIAYSLNTKIFGGNIKVLLFEDEEYKGQIFRNYNIDKKLRVFV